MSDLVVRTWIGLLQKLGVRIAVPDSGPRLISPGKTEWKIGITAIPYLLERSLQYATTATEPIVPVAKALNPAISGQLCLTLPSLWHP
jgi:hypothetical protein